MKGILLVRTVVGFAIFYYLANSRAFIRPHAILSNLWCKTQMCTPFVYVNKRNISSYKCLKNKCLYILY